MSCPVLLLFEFHRFFLRFVDLVNRITLEIIIFLPGLLEKLNKAAFEIISIFVNLKRYGER